MKGLRIVYLLQSLTYWAFFYLSTGLIFFNESTNTYDSVKTLYSSGGEDDLAIWLLGLFNFLTFVVLLFLRSRKVVLGVAISNLVFQFLALLLPQVGSFILTIVIGKNLFLLLGVVSEVTALVICFRMLKDQELTNPHSETG